MSTSQTAAIGGRRGHAAIAAILIDMDRYLPSDTINRQDYRRCRTVYGLMNTAYRRVGESAKPHKEVGCKCMRCASNLANFIRAGLQYMDLQDLERELRTRLTSLDAAKGVPVKMTQYLDELKNAIDDALARGITTDFLLEAISDILEDKPNAQPEPQPELAKMMPDTKYKKVRAELAAAKLKIQKLNAENNALTMQVKRLEMERDRMSS